MAFNQVNTGLSGSTKCSMAEEREHDQALFAKRIMEIPNNLQQRVAYNADLQAEYIGYAAREVTASTDGWMIHKFTYNANKQVTLKQVAYDTWDNRAGASYA
jgi:hypothetical protein